MEPNTPNKSKTSQIQQSETQLFSTPKKKPKFIAKQPSTSRKIKSFTQKVEKQSVSPIYMLLVFLWIVVMTFVVFLAFQTKLKLAEAQAHKKINQCKADFENNRCLSPVKKLVQYCNTKMSCMNELAYERVDKSVSYSRLLGQIMSQFAQGLGLLGLLVGLCLIGLCVRQKGTYKETTTLQFFEDS